MQVLTNGADISTIGPGSRLLTEGYYELFYNELAEARPTAFQLFKQKTSNKREEFLFEYSGLTLAQEAVIGGPTEFEMAFDENTKRTPMLLFKRGFQVAEEDEEDDLYDVLGQIGMDLPLTFTRRVESLCAGVWGGQFTTTTGFDGLPIVSTAHTFGTNKTNIKTGATTWSNRLAVDSALSPESLSSVQTLLRQTTTREGMPAGLIGRTLVVPVELESRAWEIISAMYKAFTDTNERNIFSNEGGLWPMKVVSWEWLPSPTAWSLLDPEKSPFYFFWRRKPQFRHQTDINNGIKQYYGRMRCAADAAEPRGIAGTPGA